jgi:hypothetical protein
MDLQDKDKRGDIADLLRSAVEGDETILDVIRDVRPAADGEGDHLIPRATVAISRRKLNPEPPPEPIRLPSPRRAHVFHDAPGFAAYLNRFGTDETVILGDAAGLRFAAVLDETAAEGFEIVELALQPHPLIAPWLGILDRPIPIVALAAFIIQHRRAVAAPNPRELVLALSQVRGAATVEMHQGRGRDAVNGLIVSTTIAGKQTTEIVDLPDSIQLRAPLLIGSADMDIDVDITLDFDVPNKRMLATLTSADIAVRRIEAFHAVADELAGARDGKVTIGLGLINHAPWACRTR